MATRKSTSPGLRACQAMFPPQKDEHADTLRFWQECFLPPANESADDYRKRAVAQLQKAGWMVEAVIRPARGYRYPDAAYEAFCKAFSAMFDILRDVRIVAETPTAPARRPVKCRDPGLDSFLRELMPARKGRKAVRHG